MPGLNCPHTPKFLNKIPVRRPIPKIKLLPSLSVTKPLYPNSLLPIMIMADVIIVVYQEKFSLLTHFAPTPKPGAIICDLYRHSLPVVVFPALLKLVYMISVVTKYLLKFLWT